MKKFKRYILEVCRGIGIAFMALFGQKTPRENRTSTDAFYTELTPEQADDALAKARQTMIDLGITYGKAYRKQSFDCDDFCVVLKGLTCFYASRVLPADIDRGMPVTIVSYTRRDKLGQLSQLHVDLMIGTTDGPKYYQPYPEYPEPVIMDEGELNSIEWKYT